jgi:uncharacterized protein (DUF427 family)
MPPETRVETSPKRIRVLLGGEWVADSTDAKLVWEKPYYPTYYFPADDVRTDLLLGTGDVRHSNRRGEGAVHDVKTGRATAESGATWYRESPVEEIVDHVRFVWAAMDGWFEEDEEVTVHARDPYTRVDILSSSRRVRVEVDGKTVADTTNALFLFETNLPTRHCIPKTDVRMDLLTPTELHTECPYKGEASYWSVTVDGTRHDNLVWSYPSPLPESAAIQGRVAFYNEKVDVYVDEVLQERPRTKFS